MRMQGISYSKPRAQPKRRVGTKRTKSKRVTGVKRARTQGPVSRALRYVYTNFFRLLLLPLLMYHPISKPMILIFIHTVIMTVGLLLLVILV